ncbi:NADH-quinone oxidoreductase subunit L [Flavihumibacter stibioxidans]|uniref:NADH-quinone oxidoreductase subunit L n=1 Tax=Flavihumibacter stibioxidans TaxID=1834163 RepID=A0ABR7M890_9BACT|nr:NADH-quinone oxidoreductase subunit L [Flavihumibacter stibioxidans]MBC6491255.1 NADH-quinone oxidoreductase subunit L [Flavihumibacter stibioxidans]
MLLLALIPLLPLACFVVLGLFGKKYFSQSAGWLGTLVLATSAILSLYTAFNYFSDSGKDNGVYQAIVPVQLNWLPFTSDLSINLGILLDPISVMMLVVVTVVSLMVHIFSLGYMKGEERFATYYAFLSLFTFSMLGLVLSSNIFQIYIFWELVGVSSFLLIGFYFNKATAVAASKKAFIVTRFADFGFLIGILVLSYYSNTLDFKTLIERLSDPASAQSQAIGAASFLGASALTWALALVFMGGAGKSAMFPLHIWLPDAMEGPTPVSALIHAATMVVAGVYLVARLFPVFSTNESALMLIRYIGIFSAFFAAIIACTQTDIKRVLAYSTMSQIGYMMFALGLIPATDGHAAGFTASMFHLFTHAFFKSLLFLGAGAIIHYIHSNEMRDMGGLRKLMPVTHISFLIACLAIAGIWPFAGFFSKEEILHAAYQSDKPIYFIALITGGITAFYMFRLYFNIFWGHEQKHSHAHGEGPLSMKLPLILLAILSLVAGFIPFSHYVTADGRPVESHLDLLFSIAPLLIAVTGILLAGWLYKKANDKPARLAATLGGLYQSAYKKFYIDEIYLFLTKNILFNLVGRPAAWFDRHIVDGTMNWLASTTGKLSVRIKGLQSGQVQSYALYFFGGIAALGVIFIYLWK